MFIFFNSASINIKEDLKNTNTVVYTQLQNPTKPTYSAGRYLLWQPNAAK